MTGRDALEVPEDGDLVETPEAQHLLTEPYTESEIAEFPDWYDDFINVGDDQ